MKKVDIKEKKTVFDDFFQIEEAHLQFEKFNGEMSETVKRLNFNRGDSVAAIVFNSDSDKIVLTRQFRYPSHTRGEGWMIEIVAGMLDEGVAAEDAIRKEILEEVGYKVDSLSPINSFFASPGGSCEYIHLFYAVVSNEGKVGKGGGLDEENEDIQVLEYDYEQLMSLVHGNAIMDARTLLAIYWLENIMLKQ